MLGGKQLVPAPIYNQWEASCKMVDLNVKDGEKDNPKPVRAQANPKRVKRAFAPHFAGTLL